MSNANRDYLIVCEVKNSKITIARQLNFYITDKNTSNIFVRLVNKIDNDDGLSSYVDIENSTAYNVTLRIVKPNNETMSVETTQLEPEALYQVDLGDDCKNIAGTYKCELLITTTVNGRVELNTSDPFTYLVKNSILSKVGEIVESGGITTEKLLNDLNATKAELSSQIKEIENQIESVGQPTQEQINIAIDQAITDGKVTSGGINSTAKTLLQTILQNAIYTTDQSANINALITALSTTTDPTVTNYTITNTLTNCTSSNVDTSVTGNTSYNTTITANEGYTLSNITVTMGGTDISSTAVSGNNITISSVTGDIVITASATEIITDDNLIDVSKAGIESGNGKMPDNAQTTETFIVTPYIEVNNTKQYYTNLSSKVDTEGTIINWTQKIYFYDSSKTYIKCDTYQSGDLPSKKHAVSFPTGTAYVRVLFDTRYTTITPYFGLNSDDITV